VPPKAGDQEAAASDLLDGTGVFLHREFDGKDRGSFSGASRFIKFPGVALDLV
jgi:hypothetical protein